MINPKISWITDMLFWTRNLDDATTNDWRKWANNRLTELPLEVKAEKHVDSEPARNIKKRGARKITSEEFV